MKDFLKPEEVAERLGTSVRQVQRLVRQGRIPHVRRGRLIRVPCAAWEQYLISQTASAIDSMSEGSSHVEAT